MKNAKQIILLSFIILLTLTTISATNDTDTKTIEKAYNNHDTLKEETNTVYVNCNSEKDDEDGSFNAPYKTINNENLNKISPDSTVYLLRGTYEINSISINKNVSIIGESSEEVTIVPLQSTSTFTITKDSKVLLKNFTLKDFTSDNSPAINNKGILTIDNVNFTNNIGTTTNNRGGCISNSASLRILNSNFEKSAASFGAALYNMGNATINNSVFDDNQIYNVGGAIYSVGGNLTVYDSYFSNNKAKSGASIYNAAGYMYVNNTDFYNNDAKDLFGGAIYSTGVTITNNSRFELNHANIDGGAITNTNNFTIINCSFTDNSANGKGGSIENVPWGETENGNLTIINSTFTGNYAPKGGVIINYGKTEYVGEKTTITIRNSVFEYNSAEQGAIIYNEQDIDFEGNVFYENDAEEFLIYSTDESVKSINNNWWGTNNLTQDIIGLMPNKWVVLDFTNTTPFVTNVSTNLQASLNRLNTGETIDLTLPPRSALFSSEDAVFDYDEMLLAGMIHNNVLGFDEITVMVDNQKLSLKPINTTLTSITIDPILNKKFGEKVLISGKAFDRQTNPLNKADIIITINDKRYTTKTDTYGRYNLTSTAVTMGLNNVTATIVSNDTIYSNTTNSTFNVLKQDMIINVDSIGTVKFMDNVIVSGNVTDAKGMVLFNTRVWVNVNGRTYMVVTGNDGRYTFNANATHIGENVVTVAYGGNDYYNSVSSGVSFNAIKQDMIINVDSIGTVKFMDNVIVSGNVTDVNGMVLFNTRVWVNVNGKYYRAITDNLGVFRVNVTASRIGENVVTVSYGGNDYYNGISAGVSFNAIKQDVVITIDKIGNARANDVVVVSGRVTDANDNILFNTRLWLTVNSKSYKVTTSSDGTYNSSSSGFVIGKNRVFVSYNGNDYYNNCSVETKFVVKN